MEGIHTPEQMRAYMEGWPEEYKLVIDRDVVVAFAIPESAAEWRGAAFINHIPSMSQVIIDWDGSVKVRDYKNDQGGTRLEEILADQALLQRIRGYIELIWTPTP
ncbi:MAG: hypothetical protein ACE5JL_00950 [Dehalococcoidia bacterium]